MSQSDCTPQHSTGSSSCDVTLRKTLFVTPNPLRLSARFEDALAYAAHLHAGQPRKDTAIPYVAHLLAVCSLVLEDGGDEDEAIAALLHDGPEDAGGHETLEEIRRRFGDRVADIVADCSDTFETPKPPWRERKEAYLAHLFCMVEDEPGIWQVGYYD